jgi:multiple sugar transport system substrate-binding protein
VSACSGGGAAPLAGSAPTAAPEAASTQSPGGASVPAASKPGSAGSSQASGELSANADAPQAPVVARSRTTGRPITLEIWLTDWEQSTQQLFNDQLVPQFEAANPDIAVNIQYLDWRVFTEKLIAAHAGGVLPDVYQAGAEYVAPLATKGMALDISKYVASWGQQDDFYESAWNTVTYQGKPYGIPVLSAPQTLMYRKDMLNGAQPPTDWESLKAAATQATKRDGDKFLVTGFNAHPVWQQYLWFLFQNGGDVFAPDGKVTVNSPEAVEALDYFASLFNGDSRVASKSTIAAPTANVGAMAANLVAMQLGNQLTVRDFRLNNPQHANDLVIAPPLKMKDQVTTTWTDWLAIARNSKNPDAAWKFVSFVADKDNLLKYNETMYFIPPRKSLRTEGYMADPQLQQFVAIMEQYGKTIRTTPAALEVYQTILSNAVSDAVYGKKTAKQALDDAAKKTEQALKR